MEVTQENINGITFNKTDKEMSWRLIHDRVKVIDLFESSGCTQTVHEVFLAASLEACQTQIYSLSLEYNP
jgi:hypothetical protein